MLCLGQLVDLGDVDHPPAAGAVDLDLVCAHRDSGCDSAPGGECLSVPERFPWWVNPMSSDWGTPISSGSPADRATDVHQPVSQSNGSGQFDRSLARKTDPHCIQCLNTPKENPPTCQQSTRTRSSTSLIPTTSPCSASICSGTSACRADLPSRSATTSV